MIIYVELSWAGHSGSVVSHL